MPKQNICNCLFLAHVASNLGHPGNFNLQEVPGEPRGLSEIEIEQFLEDFGPDQTAGGTGIRCVPLASASAGAELACCWRLNLFEESASRSTWEQGIDPYQQVKQSRWPGPAKCRE